MPNPSFERTAEDGRSISTLGRIEMTRATIVVSVDDAAEVAAVEAWFDRWGKSLSHRSQNHGCGCCVDIWEIEAPTEAISELPPKVHAGDEWTHGG